MIEGNCAVEVPMCFWKMYRTREEVQTKNAIEHWDAVGERIIPPNCVLIRRVNSLVFNKELFFFAFCSCLLSLFFLFVNLSFHLFIFLLRLFSNFSFSSGDQEPFTNKNDF